MSLNLFIATFDWATPDSHRLNYLFTYFSGNRFIKFFITFKIVFAFILFFDFMRNCPNFEANLINIYFTLSL